MDSQVIPVRRHAQSPVSLVANGRGYVKKPHPQEIRIPDCLCTFSGNAVGLVLNGSGNGSHPGSREDRPSRGRGRGTASFAGPPTKTYSSREKLIAHTLDAQKMDERDGKGFLMKKFLGEQMDQFLDANHYSFSHSSGHSRKSCPPTLPADRKNKTEWPTLSKQHGGPSSLHNQEKGMKTKGSKNCKKKPGALTADSNCNMKQSSTIVKDETIQNETKSAKNAPKSEVEKQDATKCAENLCERSQAVEKSNLNNNHSDKNEKENVESEKSCQKMEEKAYMHNASLSTDAVDEFTSEREKTLSGTGEEISLRDVASLISAKIEEKKNDATEVLDEAVMMEAKLSNIEKEDIITETEEEELNYKLFVRHEEFQPGDVSPLTGPNVLQVEGLPKSINDEDVSDLFFSCGTVTACKVLRDAETKLCIGVAYIRLEESAACAMAVSSFDSEPSPFSDVDGDEEVPLLKVRHFLPSS